MTTLTVPLFPLRTVLFPGGPMPLRVFEPRYLDMVSDCVKHGRVFGIVLLAEGPEVGNNRPTSMMKVGTLAKIIDWYQGADGLLGITAMGTDKFRMLASERKADGLNVGKIELLKPEPAECVPDQYQHWPEILRAVVDDLGKLYETIDRHYDDASWLSFRFAEILPIDMEQRQQCLEMENSVERLHFLQPLLGQMSDAQEIQ